MFHGQATSVLANFCQRHQLPALSFNQQGLCHLLLNNQLPISVRSDPQQQRLTLIAQVQPALPTHPSSYWLENCLSAALNPLFGNPIGFGWHADMGLIAYSHLSLDADSVSEFDTVLANLIEWVERWRKDNPQ